MPITTFLDLPDYILGLIACYVNLSDGAHVRKTCTNLSHRFWTQRMIIISRQGCKDEYHNNDTFWTQINTSIKSVQHLTELCHGSNPIWLLLEGIQFFKNYPIPLTCLSRAHNVKLLSIENSNISGKCLQHIAQMPQLVDLRICKIQKILPVHLHFLRTLKKLKNLTLSSNNIILLPNLNHLTSLKRLNLSYNRLMTTSLKALYGSKNLELLDIRGNILLDKNSITELEHQLPTTLILSDTNAVKLDAKLNNSLEQQVLFDLEKTLGL